MANFGCPFSQISWRSLLRHELSEIYRSIIRNAFKDLMYSHICVNKCLILALNT